MRPVRHSEDLRGDAASEHTSDVAGIRGASNDRLDGTPANAAHQHESRERHLHVLPDGTSYLDDGQTDNGAPPPQKILGVVSGEIVVLRNGVALALNSGDGVLAGDQVQTGAGTSGVITLMDGTVIDLARAPQLHDILAAVSSGIGIDEALSALVAPSAEQARQLAGADSGVSAAIDVFKSTFVSAMGHGASPDHSFREAERMFWTQIELSKYVEAASPEHKLLAALADGADAEQIARLLTQLSGPNGNSGAFENSLSSALAAGASLAEATEQAIRISLQVSHANAVAAGNASSQLALALASGENVSTAINAAGGANGGATFEAALGASLAAGTSPGEAAAAASATAAQTAAASAAAANNPAAQLAVALASGQNVGGAVNAAGGANSGAAFEAALGANLAGGSSPGEAAASASETASQTAQANAVAASSPTGQLAAALATGQNVSAAVNAAGGAGGGAAFEAALGNNLASGATVGDAAAAAGETASQTSQANAAAASSPGGQLVAALASGQNVGSAVAAAGGGNGGAAFEAALGANIAGGSSPAAAAAAAGETASQTAQAAAQSTSNEAAALASGTATPSSVSAAATSTTSSPSGSSSDPSSSAQTASAASPSPQDAQASIDVNTSSTEPDSPQDENNQQVQPTPVPSQPSPVGTATAVMVVTANPLAPSSNSAIGPAAIVMQLDPVNARPENRLPPALTASEDTDLLITGLSITDPDAGGGSMTTTLSVSHGTLTIAAVDGAAVRGSGTGQVVLTGSLAQINATLSAAGNVVYRGQQDFNGLDTLKVLTSDGGNTGTGGVLTDTDTIAITVVAVNDAPINTVGAAQSIDEDSDLAIAGLSVRDIDAYAASITTTLSVQHGILTVAAVAGASVLGSGTATVTLTGSQADINATLAAAANVIYRGDLDYNGSDDLTVVTSDGGNIGSGGTLTDTDTVGITVNAINDAPVNTVGPAQAVDEDTDLAITGLSVRDVDALSGSITSTLSVEHGTLTVVAVGGALVFGSGSGTVAVTGSQADINATLAAAANVIYHADQDYNGSDTLTIRTDDAGNIGSGGALTDTDSVAITVNAVNDAPVNTVGPAQIVDEDSDLAITGISVRDIDALNASITTTLSVQHGILTVSAIGGAGVLGSGTGTVTLTGSQADINATLAAAANVVYHADGDYNGGDILTIVTDDRGNSGSGGALTDTDTVGITVNAVNDAPVNTVVAALTVDEDTSLSISGLGVSDVDAFGTSITTTLSVQHGILTVATAGGANVLGSGTGTVTLTGSQADINAALAAAANVVYLADPDYNGSDILTIVSNDGGSSGSGGALIDTDTVAITVNAVNDAPVNTVPAAQTASEDVDLFITGLSVRDVDAFGTSITTTLSVQHGILTVVAVGGSVVLGSGTGTVTLTGSQADINATLAAAANVVYHGELNFNGSDTLEVVTNDGGNSGSGGALADVDTVAITVNAVNDAPVASGNAVLPAIDEDSLTPAGATVSSLFASHFTDHADQVSGGSSANGFAGIAISDYTADPAKGSWQYSIDNGSHWIDIGDATLATALTLAAADMLRFVPAPDHSGAASTLSANLIESGASIAGGSVIDLTNSTGGTSHYSSDSVLLSQTINAVNDAPVAAAPASYSATEQTPLSLKGTGLSVSDVDAGTGALTVTLSVTEGTLTATAGDSGAGVSGSGTSALTITGTVAQINALLASGGTGTLSYVDSTDTPAASTTLTFAVNDNGNAGSGGALSASTTSTITIAAVNDAPVAVITPSTYSATEQTSLVLKGTGLSISDVDAGTGSMRVTLSVTEGTLIATAGDSGAGVSGSGTSSLTITGTVAQINALMASGGTSTLSYVDNTDTPSASATLTMSVNDNGNTGGGSLVGSDTAVINITAVNDAPVAANDVLSAVREDSGVRIISFASLLANDFTGPVNEPGQTLTITALSNIQGGSAVINGTNIEFTPAANFNGTASFDYTVRDNGQTAGADDYKTATASVSFQVTAVPDAPAGASRTIAIVEDGSYVFSAADFGFSDPNDSPANSLAGVKITTLPSAGVLTNNGVSVTAGSVVSSADINAGRLVFTPAHDGNGNGYSAFTFQVQDSGTLGGQETRLEFQLPSGWTGTSGAPWGWGTVTLAPGHSTNQTAMAFAEGGRTVETNASGQPNAIATSGSTYHLSFDHMDLFGYGPGSITIDVYAGSTRVGHFTHNYSAANLTASFDTTTVVPSAEDGNALRLVFSANSAFTLDNVSLSRVTTPGVYGPNLLVNGDFGSLGYFIGENTDPTPKSIIVDVAPVNDAPVAAAPASYSATEQTPLSLKGTGLSVSDVDAAAGSLTVTLSVTEGTLTATAGDSGAGVSGSGTSALTITGTVAQINALLASGGTGTLSYVDSTDTPAASATLTFAVNDNGNSGNGGAQSASTTSTITIAAVNDAPVAVITPSTYSATEQTSLVLKGTGLSISDVDAGTGSMRVTLSVTEGTLIATAGDSGAGVSGSGTSSLTITGTVAQINALMASGGTSTLSYIDNTDTPSASATLTLSVNDNGNTGGGSLTATDIATINIAAVNDAPVVGYSSIPTVGLAALYKFDDAANLGLDSSGLGNNLVLFGSGVSYAAGGEFGGGLSLGGNGYLSTTNGRVPGGFPLGNSPYTLSAWVQEPGAGGREGIIGFGNYGSVGSVNALRFEAGNGILNYWWSNDLLVTAPQVFDHGFHNLTATYDGVTRRIYVDGVQVGSSSGGAPNVANANFAIGLTNGSEYFSGILDNVAVYNVALSPAQVQSLIGANGPLLSADEDTARSIAGLSISDPDAGSAPITVTLSVGHGSLTVAAIGGATVTGSGTATVTITGAQADINATLAASQNVIYQSVPNYSGSDTLTVTASDEGNTGSGGPLTATGTATITVNAVNDAPVNTVPSALSVDEDTGLAIAGLSVGDLDSASGTITTTLSVAHGTLAVTSAGGAAVSGSGTGTVTLTGSQSQINVTLAAAGNVIYTGARDYNGSDTLTVTTSDGGGTGAGGARSDTDTVSITVVPVNDAPVVVADPGITIDFEGIVPSNGYGNYSNGAAFGGLNWSEPGDFVQIIGGTLASSGLWSIDGTAVLSTAYARPATSIEVTRNGNTFAVSDFDLKALQLTETVTITGRLAGNTVYQQTYDLTLMTPVRITVPHDTIDFLSISGGESKLTIDNFVYSAGPAARSFAEGGAPTAVSGGLTLTDIDSATLAGATVSISGHFQSGADLLGFVGQNGIAGSYDSGTGVLTLSGVSSVANYQAVLRSVTYSNASDTPSTEARTISYQVDDGGAVNPASSVSTVTVNVTATNDAPGAIAPAGYNATEQVSLNLKGSGLAISDVDAGTQSVTTTLSVSEGILTATPGDSGASVAGSGTSSLTITGTLAQLNALLASGGTGTLSYVNNTDAPSQTVTLTLSVNDNGNAGSGGALTGDATSTITVSAVNDAPVAVITPTNYSATENVSLDLKGSGLSISDVDAGSGPETVTLSVTEGILTATAGDSGAAVSGSGTASLTIAGTVAQINALMASGGTGTLAYIDNTDTPSANATLTLAVNDNGNTGGGDLTASDTAVISIAAVNDAPVPTAPSSYSATEQTSLTLKGTGLSISDADAGNGPVTATLSVSEGTLTATAGNSGASVSGSGTSSLTIAGTLTQINALLASGGTSTLSYIDNTDTPAASATLTLSVNDNGNAGSGGAQSASISSTITIAGVNDAPLATAAFYEDAGTFTRSTANYAVRSSYTAFSSSALTVDFFVKMNAQNNSVDSFVSYAIGAGSGLDNELSIFILDSDSKLHVKIHDQDLSYDVSTLFDQNWHHIAVTYNVSTGASSAYYDGALAGSGTYTNHAAIGSGGTLVLGQEQDSVGGGFAANQALIGNLSNLNVWSRVLSGAEVTAASQNAQNLADTSLVAAYRFNTDSGSYQDITGHGHDLTTVGTLAAATGPELFFSALEKTPLSLKNAGMTVGDIDGGIGILTATLSVTEGVITGSAGNSGVSLSGSGTSALAVSGTVAQINSFLSATSTSDLDFTDGNTTPSSSVTLTLSVNDNGNTGTGGARTVSDTTTIHVTDLAAGVTFTGTSGADTINAATGTITGFTGGNATQLKDLAGDTFVGQGGNDTIVAGPGADTITGGAGADTLTGGLGADSFRFATVAESTPSSFDTITDFVNDSDRIDLSAIDAIAGGSRDAFVFVAKATPTTNPGANANSVTWYQDTANNQTVIMAETTGDATADMLIKLTGLHIMTSHDFTL